MRIFGTRHGLPGGWEATLDDGLAQWADLNRAERDKLASDADQLLRHKYWEAAHGFALDDQMRTLLAAQAALVILGLDIGYYRRVRTVVVYPSAITRHRIERGPVAGVVMETDEPLLGESFDLEGPVVVSWDAARSAARHPEHGSNVVFHEFSHKLDMLDGIVDGTPPIADRKILERWPGVCTPILDHLRTVGPTRSLRSYAATNPGEFFAVSTEAFFTIPVYLRHDHPDLYDLLTGFYNQDPARRQGRGRP